MGHAAYALGARALEPPPPLCMLTAPAPAYSHNGGGAVGPSGRVAEPDASRMRAAARGAARHRADEEPADYCVATAAEAVAAADRARAGGTRGAAGTRGAVATTRGAVGTRARRARRAADVRVAGARAASAVGRPATPQAGGVSLSRV